MSALSWSEKNLSILGRKFLRNVLNNMRNYQEATVQFGQTGLGVSPHYQITFPNGNKWAIDGRSHDTFSRADDFDIKNISIPFSLSQVESAYKKSS